MAKIYRLSKLRLFFRYNSEPASERKSLTSYWKKGNESFGSDCEKQYAGSSSESLGFAIGRSKASPVPSSNSEIAIKKDVKFIKTINDYSFKDERIVMVTSRFIPFMICSTISYKKSQR